MLDSLLSLYLQFADISKSKTNVLDPNSLVLKVEDLVNRKDYAAALPFALQSLDASEKAYGTNHPLVAVPLNDLAYVYYELGQYTNAEPLYFRALKIREATLGSNHLYTANVLINIGKMYDMMNQFSQSLESYQRAVVIIGNAYGLKSAEAGDLFDNIGWIQEEQGDYLSAKSTFAKAIEILSSAFGEKSPRRLPALRDYARVCVCLADYTKAEQTLIQVLSEQERAYGTNALEICDTLNAFGILYDKVGDLEKAENCHRRILSIYERLPEKDRDGIMTCYDNIGLLRIRQGDFGAAEEYLLKSVHMAEELYGTNCPESVQALNNLAVLYREINNYKKAEDLLNLAIKTHAAVVTNGDILTATLLANLADVFARTGDYKKADELFGASLGICNKITGDNHPDTAIVMRERADMYKTCGLYDEAKPMLEKVLAIDENQLGEYHPDTLTTLFDLGVLYCDAGDFQTGNTLLKKALAGTQRTFGTNAFQACLIENSLAMGEMMLNHREKALEYAKSERRHSELNLARTLAFTSAAERSLNQQYVRSPINNLAQLGYAPELAQGILRYKGIILDSDIEDQLAAKASKSPQINLLMEKLKQQKHRLNNLMLAAPENPLSNTRSELDQERAAQQQIFDDLQKDILKQATQLGQSRRALSVTTPEVQSELTTNAALLEFIRYDRYLGKTDFEQCYGLVLINHNNEPAWIPLGLATNIEANLHQYEALMRSRDRGNADILKTLYAQIMAPALKQLPAGVTNLIISPDAELNFLSFATLLDDHGEFVGEHYKVSYVASGRDLVFGRQVQLGNGQLAVFANADFNAAPVVMTNSHVTQLAMMDSDRRDYDGITLGALPGTGNEAEYLRSHSPGWKLTSSVYLGAEATEAQVKALHSPCILHLATHGFFLPDNAPASQKRRLGPGDKLPVVLSNPMQRSGLALAGAQKTLDAWSRGEVPDTENDGILMADEVSLLDLQNTWLVTLSACDTGIGEARAGEGVMGLRRGFIQAGAQNLLMTLWPVSDKWTTDLMEAFYKRALQTKDAPGALAEVQGAYLKRLRQEKNAVLAARLAGPFVMNFQGKPGNN